MKAFKLKIQDREGWDNRTAQENRDLFWFTNGSPTGMQGWDIWWVPMEVNVSLGKYVTVFQVKLTAILYCAQEIMRNRTHPYILR